MNWFCGGKLCIVAFFFIFMCDYGHMLHDLGDDGFKLVIQKKSNPNAHPVPIDLEPQSLASHLLASAQEVFPLSAMGWFALHHTGYELSAICVGILIEMLFSAIF